MASSYVYRGAKPTPMALPPPKKIRTPGGQRLSIITEQDDVLHSTQHHRLSNLPLGRRFHHGPLPRADEEKKPPSYASNEQARHDPEQEQQAGGFRAQLDARGGWRRLAIVVAVVLAVVIALAVGLGVGLTQNHHHHSPSASPSPTATAPPAFPQGSYTISTFLTNTSADCTSNAATWSCPPGSTYSDSPSASRAYFNWVITASSSSSYLISSVHTGLDLDFSNATLSLVDAGSPDERYTFSTTMTKQVYPAVALTDDNALTVCFYNQTTLTANLYTSRNDSVTGNASSTATTDGFDSWPAAVQVFQSSPGGDDVPNCYREVNGVVQGAQITSGFQAQPTDSACSCIYES